MTTETKTKKTVKKTKPAVEKSNKFSVIQTGGKQYIVKQGDSLKIEKIAGNEGDNVVFDNVLLTAENENIKVGNPLVAGEKVSATIVSQGRAAKVTVIRYKSKTRYHKKKGHRQPFTEVKIK